MQIIAKYLDIMSAQDSEIQRLKSELEIYRNKVKNLRQQKEMYKENCKYWQQLYKDTKTELEKCREVKLSNTNKKHNISLFYSFMR